MTSPKEEMTLNRVLAWLTIATILAGTLGWIFSTQATAQRADINADKALQRLESKADKTDTEIQLKRIFDKLDSIDNYLRDRK